MEEERRHVPMFTLPQTMCSAAPSPLCALAFSVSYARGCLPIFSHQMCTSCLVCMCSRAVCQLAGCCHRIVPFLLMPHQCILW
jgi:hypothetical protein